MNDSLPKLTLYYSPGACSLAPHIILEETGLPCDRVRTAIAEGQHLTDSYRAINPQLRVPALLVDGALLTEVPAILMYLSSLAPQVSLLPPSGSYDYGKCLELLAYLSSTLHIAYAQYWRPQRFVTDGFSATEDITKEGYIRINEINGEIEANLKSEWAIGNRYTIADSYLLVFYRWGVRIGIDMQSICPRWTAWVSRVIQRPTVRRAIEIEGIGFEWAPNSKTK